MYTVLLWKTIHDKNSNYGEDGHQALFDSDAYKDLVRLAKGDIDYEWFVSSFAKGTFAAFGNVDKSEEEAKDERLM